MTLGIILSIFSVSQGKVYAKANYPNDFKLLSQNVYMLSQALYPNWGQVKRAELIADADYIKGYDIFILNEVFDNEASEVLLNDLTEQYPYQTPVLGRSTEGWNQTLGDYSHTVPEDGGVAIVSKWPIEEKIQYVYDEGCSGDAMANKGFVYVKINKNGHDYHTIGTHMQSTDSLCSTDEAAEIRSTQMKEIQQFIDRKNIPEDEVIYIGGDLNVMKGTDEYKSMIDQLNVTPPHAYTGYTATWDPTTNSIARYNYPEMDGQYLDYIFVERDHAQPNQWYIDAKKTKSSEWSVTSWGKTYKYNDFSDHYPVSGSTVPMK